MEQKSKKIVLTGGGTAGHVSPNLALLPYLQEAGYEVTYIGSKTGIEKNLIADFGLPYVGISTGKLRRYFDLKNFTDPFRVIHGYREARKFLKKYRPDVVFSKGGFVSVPVVRAAGSLHIPCVIHESDMTPGLANKLCFSSATKICCNFPETLKMVPADKAVLTGTPIRSELFTGDREKGLAICGFSADKPVLMVMGGSQGAVSVNNAVRGTRCAANCRNSSGLSRSCICAARGISTSLFSTSRATASSNTSRKTSSTCLRRQTFWFPARERTRSARSWHWASPAC